jgi:recombination protein RecA
MANAKMQKFLQDMEKKFGKNVVRVASEVKAEMTKRVSTGSVWLDIDTRGGYPVGRFTQVSGAFSSTKSTTVYHGIRNFQEYFKEIGSDLQVVLVQGENGSWTDEYGRSIGIDTDNLLINECASMEEALEISRQMQEREIAGLIVWDSMASFVPMKEQDSNMEDSVQMGLKPKLFDEYFRKFQAINNKLSREGKHTCTLIGINQLREKIGAYGDPEYNPGGRSIGFTASLDIRLRRGDWITVGTGQNKAIIGQQVKYKIHKSKVSVPQKTGMWDVYLDEGGTVPQGYIDNFKETVLASVAFGVVERGGAWFTYKDIKVQGADNLVAQFRENPELYEEVKAETMKLALEESEDEHQKFLNALSEEERNYYDEHGTLDGFGEPKKEKKKSAKKPKAENSKKKAVKKNAK